MVTVNVICEGETEAIFVKKLLFDFFLQKNIKLVPHNLGGGFDYNKLKKNIINFLNSDHKAYVTTMVDLYGSNNDYPEYEGSKRLEPLQKVEKIENAVKLDILSSKTLHNRKFISYFQLHEFEALLFSDSEILTSILSLDNRFKKDTFANIRNKFESPEYINDSPQTAPSKRILSTVPSYNKIIDGFRISEEIGLEKLRKECTHFNNWLIKLEDLADEK